LILTRANSINVIIFGLDEDIASPGTARTDGFSLMEIPHPLFEAKLPIGQCADGTNVGDAIAVWIVKGIAWRQGNESFIASLDQS